MTEHTPQTGFDRDMNALIEWYDPPEINPHNGWYNGGKIHIYAPPVEGRAKKAPTWEHWPKLKYWSRKRRSVLTDCCCCRMDTRDTVSSGIFQAWYGWTWTHECAPGKGCDANPRRKFGMELRSYWKDGP